MLRTLDIKLLYCENCHSLYKEVNEIIPIENKILIHLTSLPNVSIYAERESWMNRNAPSGAICEKCKK